MVPESQPQRTWFAQKIGPRMLESQGRGVDRREAPECGELNWAIGIDMYTVMCIKLMTNKNLQYKKTNKQNN